jgi:hypothetical protein
MKNDKKNQFKKRRKNNKTLRKKRKWAEKTRQNTIKRRNRRSRFS